MSLGTIKKGIKSILLKKLLSGNNVTCNICGSSFSTFRPYLGRVNAECFECGSLERTRLIKYFIDNLALIKKGSKILHIAPEKALFDIFHKEYGQQYIAGDKFEEGYKYPIGTQYVDITNMSFADESFDLVICMHVLEHVPDDTKGISEIYRVIKKGGGAILQVPFEADREVTYEDDSITTPEARRKHFGQIDHVRIYGKDYIDRFLKPGFKIEHQDFSENLDIKTRNKYVFKKEDIFLLRK